MSFSKKKKLGSKSTSIILIIAVIAGIGMGGYYLFSRYINGIKQDYEGKLTVLRLERYNNKKQVYIPKGKIAFGTQLKEELFNLEDIYSSLDKSLYMSPADIGKYSKAEILPGIPAMKYMVTDEKIQNDIRREEFNMFLLQSNLKKDEFIDLRIMYPNGENYIVLSKKKIRDINLTQNTIWCWLDEREILTVSSAIVDAYITQGTKLYVVTYVEPSSQTDSIPTYPANVDVMNLMDSDPNIVDKAKLYLAEKVRIDLEQRLKAITPETTEKVEAEVSKEYSGVTGTIQKDAIDKNNTEGTSTQQQAEQPLSETTESTTQSQSQTTNDGEKKEGAKGGFFN